MENEKRFARMVQFRKDGSVEVDLTIDASLYGLFAFGAYRPDDERVRTTMEQVVKRLWNPHGGMARYEGDMYYRETREGPGNPWFVATLWLAQYEIARSHNKEELNKALSLLEWVANHALPSGVLAEQVSPLTGQPLSVSPLTWSHGTYIAVVQEFLNRLIDLEQCPVCSLPKVSKQRVVQSYSPSVSLYEDSSRAAVNPERSLS